MERNPQLQAQQHFFKSHNSQHFISYKKKSSRLKKKVFEEKKKSMWSAHHPAPTRRFTSELEDNFSQTWPGSCAYRNSLPPSFDASADLTITTGFFFKLPVFPGCQNDLHEGDLWSRSSVSTEDTCSVLGIWGGWRYLPISTHSALWNIWNSE